MDESGERVNLRGFNLGNWLQLEFWMMGTHIKYSGGDVHDQCTLEGVLTERFGQAEKKRLMSIYYESWMTERDFDHMKDLGINLVRLPFMFNVVEDEANPFTVRTDGFRFLDWAVDEAEERGIYVIFDLHGAAGSQGWEQHSGCEGKNELWASDDYRARTKWLWEQIAERYKDRSVVAGHGLLNEPWGTDAQTLAEFSYELFDAVRAKDPNHVIILPGHNTGIHAYGNPNERPNTENVAIEMHFYPGVFGWRVNDNKLAVHSEWLHCNVPDSYTDWTGQDTCEWDQRMRDLDTAFFIGEFQPWTNTGSSGGLFTRKTFDIYNMYGWASTAWSYKLVTHDGSSGDPNAGWGWGAVTNSSSGGGLSDINVSTASMEEIEGHFAQFATQPLVANSNIKAWMDYQPTVGERIEAEIFASHVGVTMTETNDEGGGFHAASIQAGDRMAYEVNIPSAGDFSVEFRVASAGEGGSLRVLINGEEKGVITVPSTGGLETWQTTAPATVSLPSGLHRIEIESAAGELNMNWFSLMPE